MAAELTVYQRRILFGAAFAFVAFLGVGARLVDVTAFNGKQAAPRKSEAVFTARADLVDRNGDLIARDQPADDLYARPRLLKDKRAAAAALAAATGADLARIKAVLNDKYSSALIAAAWCRKCAPRSMR